jgi:3-oxoacyl-[acyl-carrier-protein] synthase III
VGQDPAPARVRVRLCGSDTRYYDRDPSRRVADLAVAAADRCLAQAGVEARELDLVINGSVRRDDFEPATAMEISAKLGITRVQAFDVTSACAGLLQGVHVAAGLMHMDPSVELALICAGDLTGDFLSYDIQTKDDVAVRSAGLTIGDGGSAVLLARRPRGPSGRILALLSEAHPEHYDLCSAPIDGSFHSRSAELFKLNRHVPDHIRALLGRCGLEPAAIDRWICHQPSDWVVLEIVDALGVERERAPRCHGVFGNTINSTVPMTLAAVLDEGPIATGERLVLSSAAAGFAMVSIALEWVASVADEEPERGR